jgi:hypothetical protein
MTKLFVANATSQDHLFNFRAPNADGKLTGQLRTILIHGGQQALVADEVKGVIEQIVNHYEKYGGMVKLSEIDRTRGIKSLIYSIDKEIPADFISGKFVENGDGLNKRNEEMREIVTASVATSLHQNGLPVSSVETSVQALDDKGTPGNKQSIKVELKK